MNISRRVFLRRCSLAGVNSIALLCGTQCWAKWQHEQMASAMPELVLRELLSGEPALRSEQVVLKVPALQHNGALVPVTVETSLSDVSSITLLTSTPGEPQVASFIFPKQNAEHISTRIKLTQSTKVWSLVRAGERYFLSEKMIKLESFRLQR